MKATSELMREAVNAGRKARGAERANSVTLRVLADAVQEEGDEREAGLWRSVADHLDARASQTGGTFYAVEDGDGIAVCWCSNFARCRREYPLFRVEKATGECWQLVRKTKTGEKWEHIADDVRELTAGLGKGTKRAG